MVIYSGLIAGIWFVIGVTIAARFYPGYHHAKQFCSELGAAGSPTEKLSPLINNYPLGCWFVLFGWAVSQLADAPMLLVISGWLIILHGIGTWVAGFFAMDADAYTVNPTSSGKIHSLAGFIMFLSLLIAPVLVVLSPSSDHISTSFRGFSALCIVVTLYFTVTFVKAIKNKTNPGTHQRLSYGAQLLWLAGYSIVLG